MTKAAFDAITTIENAPANPEATFLFQFVARFQITKPKFTNAAIPTITA